MIAKPGIVVDDRDRTSLLAELLARRAGYTPEWQAPEKSAGWALAAIVARQLEAVIQRLNQAPGRNKLAFLDQAGLNLVAAQAARVPVVFQLNEQASGGSAPARTPVAAAPPPGSTQQITFETDRATGVTAGKLSQVFSIWPGRDEYIDHSADFSAGKPVLPFARSLRRPAPHHIFLSHDALLALAGNVELSVEFELTHPASQPLDLLWEYWDGKVWRGFLSTVADCLAKNDQQLDSTQGLTRSGSYVLEADCAQAAKTQVNGSDGYWLRGRLTQPLPPDPDQALPEVERIQVSSTVNRALLGILSVSEPYAPRTDATTDAASAVNLPSSAAVLGGRVLNQAGQPVVGAIVVLSNSQNASFGEINSAPTTKEGEFSFPNVALGPPFAFRVIFEGLEFSAAGGAVGPKEPPSTVKPKVDLKLVVDGLKPDKAFADGTTLDVSKPFYPVGQQTQPGSTFYFTNKEIFSKPGAKLRIYVARTRSPQDEATVTVTQKAGTANSVTPLDHAVAWEYWNGRVWAPLAPVSHHVESKLDLNATELVDLTVPVNMEPTKVNGEEALWMRVRVESGSYGFRQEVTFISGHANDENKFSYVVPQPPVLADFRLGYTWQYGPFHPDQVLTYNDFRYEDHTYESTWPGAVFLPFQRMSDVSPALYLGFNKRPPVDVIGTFFDIEENPDETSGPALVWEYWDGSEWRHLSADDETGNLRRPGIVSFVAESDDTALSRFGTPLNWVRARLKEDGPPGEPVLTGIFPNAVWASERRTVRDLPLGTSLGTPNQVFPMTQTPVLPGERIEIRELAAARANVEWRILATELFGGDSNQVKALETLLGKEGTGTDVSLGALRLVRNRQKQVAEAWVQWEGRAQLFYSGPQDRHYAIDRARGRVYFGDGETGKIPPLGAAILVREMAAGGGAAGNVAAKTVTQLLGVVPGIQAVFNPRAAEGGADGEMPEAALDRGPRTIRHRGRALEPADYETLAFEASPAVAVVRVIPGRNPAGRILPGWMTVMILPHSNEERPYPSFGLREQVRRFLEDRAPADLAGLHRIVVSGPDYLPVDVAATIAPVVLSEAGIVEKRARAALEEFFHPLRGGPGSEGWDLGRDVFLSDVAAVLERVEGVDYVRELALLRDGVPQGESLAIPDMSIVAAGAITLKMEAAER